MDDNCPPNCLECSELEGEESDFVYEEEEEDEELEDND